MKDIEQENQAKTKLEEAIPVYKKLTANSPEMLAPGSPHILLTCENHPNLRWTTKNISASPDKNGDIRYNGMRHLFFSAWESPKGAVECDCSADKLIGIEGLDD